MALAFSWSISSTHKSIAAFLLVFAILILGVENNKINVQGFSSPMLPGPSKTEIIKIKIELNPPPSGLSKVEDCQQISNTTLPLPYCLSPTQPNAAPPSGLSEVEEYTPVSNSTLPLTSPEICGDGVDNDGNGYIDESHCCIVCIDLGAPPPSGLSETEDDRPIPALPGPPHLAFQD